jgi:heme-degrading monooxygenase HmoA
MQLHQDEALDFIRAGESEIIPLFRKQPGFRDELVLIDPDRSRVESISFWNSQENAERFGKAHTRSC